MRAISSVLVLLDGARGALVLLSVVSVFACSDAGLDLTVELRTDLSPGFEFASVETTVDGGVPARVPALTSDDFIEGVRIAEFDGLEAGVHEVMIRLRAVDGEELYVERIRLTLSRDFGLRAVIGRDCLRVDCPSADERCMGGLCVPLDCHVDSDDDACGEPVCVEAADCTVSVPACVHPVCAEVACLWELRDGDCASGERCDVTRGCVSDGPTDAGVDGDAGGVDSDVADAGCLFDSDCPADEFPPFGACIRGSQPRCSGLGERSRVVTRWQCVSRACQSSTETEMESCLLPSEGNPCLFGAGGELECGVCRSGTCLSRDGEGCEKATFPGTCWAGNCCTSCWDGSACLLGGLDTRCGRGGAACVDCTAMSQTCVAGACTP